MRAVSADGRKTRSFRGVTRLLFVIAVVLSLSVGAYAAQQAAGDGASDQKELSSEEVKAKTEEAANKAKEAINSVPDPAQAATQASEEALSQGKPKKEHEFVYSLSPWTGTKFGGTFAPKQANAMYLMAGHASILNTQETDVYYWPITGEYMANWFESKEEIKGKLQIEQNGKVVDTLEKVDYAYYYPTGYGGAQELLLGDEAVKTYEDYQSRIDAYYDSVSEYYEAQREWQSVMDKLLKEVRESGKPKDPNEIPKPPEQPQPPQDFVYQPRKAFAVDLPAGRYTVKLIQEDGKVLPESVRTLDVFDARRSGTGFGVIPGHKWTRRFQSNDPSDTFYLDGRRVFYILPFHAKEFNAYKYTKMTNLHKPLEGEGTKSAWQWVQFDRIKSAKLQVLKDGKVIREVSNEPYYVKQTSGYALGYEIVKFDPSADASLQGRSPTFEAYQVELEGGGSYQLRFVDENGKVLAGSTRMVRSVNRPHSALYLITLIPLVMGAIIFIWRRSKGRKKKAPVSSSAAVHESGA